MQRDAGRKGRNAWPFVAMIVVAGSFGPLLYLLTERRPLEAGYGLRRYPF